MFGFVFFMIKDFVILEKKWIEMVEWVWEKFEEGKDVVFVIEGDFMFYSMFIYMMCLM